MENKMEILLLYFIFMCMNILVKLASMAELISFMFYFKMLSLLPAANLNLREIKSDIVGKNFILRNSCRQIVCAYI